jgi:anti-sigma-K factor RskA
MDINKYIESGILEAYILGDVSDTERAEVEALAAAHPEIKQEIESIEIAMEQYAMAAAVTPKADILDKIKAKIEVSTSTQTENTPVNQLKIGGGFKFSYGIAASMVGLVMSLGGNAYLYSKLSDAKQQVAVLQGEKQLFTDENTLIKASYKQKESQLNIIGGKSVKKIVLAATPLAAQVDLTVFWDSASKEVLLNVAQLPTAPEGKQYQLWAIGANGPIDAGMVSLDPINYQQMKAIDGATAFAITLEDKGGKPSPNLEQLYAIGKI